MCDFPFEVSDSISLSNVIGRQAQNIPRVAIALDAPLLLIPSLVGAFQFQPEDSRNGKFVDLQILGHDSVYQPRIIQEIMRDLFDLWSSGFRLKQSYISLRQPFRVLSAWKNYLKHAAQRIVLHPQCAYL